MRFVYNDPYALRSARLEDLELTCEEGLLTVRGEVAPADHDVAGERASFENGIIRIVVPRRRQRIAHTIKVEVGNATDTSRIVMDKPELLDAVKGKGYRELETKTNRRKAPSK